MCSSHSIGYFRIYFVLTVVIWSELQSHVFAQRKGGGGGGGRVGLPKCKVTTDSKWIQKSLDSHNKFRAMHGSPPLSLNNTLSEISQCYADYLLARADESFRSTGSVYFEHNPGIKNTGIGENLYYSSTSQTEPVSPAHAVLRWYQEIDDYNFQTAQRKINADPKAPIGHLTQLLWKSTTHLGTAYASGKLSNQQTVVFVVTNYWPTGNVVWRGNPAKLYLENVLPVQVPDKEYNSVVAGNCQSWWTKRKEALSTTPENWRNSALNAHNYYRKLRGSQPLQMNDALCRVSQLWAEHLLEGGLKAFNEIGVVHQIQQDYLAVNQCNLGENSVFYVATQNFKPAAEEIVEAWYDQGKYYKPDVRQGTRGGVAHYGTKSDSFQQMIWNTSTEFCISYATSVAGNGQALTYVVANYYPQKSNLPADKAKNIGLEQREKTNGAGTTWQTEKYFALTMSAFIGYFVKYL